MPRFWRASKWPYLRPQTAQCVQILPLGRKQRSRILQGTTDFQGVSIQRSSRVSINSSLSRRQAYIAKMQQPKFFQLDVRNIHLFMFMFKTIGRVFISLL